MCTLNCTQDQSGLNWTSTESCQLFVEGSTPLKCIKTFAYSLIMLISLFGNLAVVAIVMKNRQLWTAMNYMIANMATSDLLISVFAVPREIVEIFIGPRRWLIDGLTGLILCKVVYFLQDISTAVSIQSLVVIAIDRYRGIVYPLRPPIITSKVCKVIIPITWIVAMCIHSTYLYTVRLVMQEDRLYCAFRWAPLDERSTQERYFLFVSVLLIFLPLCAILTLYALIVIELKKRKTNADGASGLRRQRQKEDAAIVKKILIIVFIFVLCITPITVSGLLYYFLWDWHLACGLDKLFSAAKFIFYSNASLNPCFYIVLSERYRQGLKDLLKRLCLKRKRIYRNEMEMNGAAVAQV